MFKRLLYIVLCIFSFVNLNFAQDVEELEKQIQSTKNPATKVDLYLQIIDAFVWEGGDYGTAKEYIQEIIEICETRDCDDLQWWAYGYLAEIEINENNFETLEQIIQPKLNAYNLNSKEVEAYLEEIVGFSFLMNGNIAESEKHLERARKILEQDFPKSKRLGNVYYYLSFAHNMNGANGKSVLLMKQSVEQYKFIGDSLKLIEGLSGLSTLYSTDGKYLEAIELVLESLELMDEIGGVDILQKYELYDLLTDLYIRNGDYLKAKEELDRLIPEFNSLSLSDEIKRNTSWSLNMSMSKVLGKLGEPDKGLVYVDSAYIYAKEINPFTVRITDLRQAALTLKSGNYEQATTRLEKLLLAMKEYDNVDAFNAVLLGLFADLYMESNIAPNELIWRDLQNIIDRIDEKNENQFNDDLLAAQKLSIILGTYNVDPNSVLRSLQSFSAIKDSMHNEEKLKVSNELLIAYETEKKEKQLEIKDLALAKKTTERNLLIASVFGLLLITGILFLYYKEKKKYATDLEDEVKRRTKDIEKSNRALKESNEELERYTYIASHNLKEPLRNIMSFVNLIKRRELVENKDALVYFDYVEKGTRQMNDVVEGLLEFSELKTKEILIENVELDNIVDVSKELVLEQHKDKIINIKTFNFPKKIQSNRDSLFLIFRNLIDNGIKYNEKPEVEINVFYEKKKEMHQFKFQDNGIGIQEEFFDEIFTSFKRLHNHSRYDGSGTGLAICKRLIKYLKGTITVESELSKGTVFTVELPVE